MTINTTILNDQTISKYTVETAVDIESLETQSVLTNVITSLIEEWSSAFKSKGIVLPFQNMSSSFQKNSKPIHCYVTSVNTITLENNILKVNLTKDV